MSGSESGCAGEPARLGKERRDAYGGDAAEEQQRVRGQEADEVIRHALKVGHLWHTKKGSVESSVTLKSVLTPRLCQPCCQRLPNRNASAPFWVLECRSHDLSQPDIWATQNERNVAFMSTMIMADVWM